MSDAPKYNVIYADPPWSYRNKKTGGSMTSGAASKYPTLTTAEICALRVPDISEKNAVLFLWATTPLLEDALQVMHAWGFRYKTKLVWHKWGTLGMGFWFRVETEDLLVGVRGKVKAFHSQDTNFLQCTPSFHSEKPAEFRNLIWRAARASFETPRCIELFARKRSVGFDAWGNEIESDIELK